MGARAFTRVAVLLGLVCGGVSLTLPERVGLPGIGVAEARSYHRRTSHRHRGASRRARRVVEQDASPVLAARPPQRPDGGAEDEARFARLRDALQVKAVALAGDGEASRAGARPDPAPRSISFDFEAGVKTTVFETGAAVREPFDVAAGRRLAAPPPPPEKGAPSS